jgi:ATP synthase protein I
MTTSQPPNRWQHDGPEIDPWSALSLILSGVLLWGAIGWGVSEWLGSRAWMGAGVLIGGVLGVLLVYLRYGRGQSGPPSPVGPVVLPGQVRSAGGATTPDAASSVLPLAETSKDQEDTP